ncbi:hypothetical protein F5Y11DRAFT_365344 [Daldinia sp. FL1419]|nr:hypothetical protein F5Y11DRAFT_365344 [Daldinia sp. FL1419]
MAQDNDDWLDNLAIYEETNGETALEVRDIQNPFEFIPIEVCHRILVYLPDVTSLVSAALSCRALYETLKDGEHIIVRSVLINSFGLSVLPVATLAYKCSPPYLSTNPTFSPGYPSDRQVRLLKRYLFDFIGNLERPTPLRTRLSLRDAIALDTYHHGVVSKLAQKFIKACARTSSSCPLGIKRSLRKLPFSTWEWDRVFRSLYHFEIFRKLFGCLGFMENDIKHLVMVFFAKFAPWENAQLATIHDFLADQVMPAFDDIARHDVTWGKHLVDFDVGGYDARIQHLLTLGLEKIQLISSADSYKDREALLKAGKEMPPGEAATFLAYLLDTIDDLNPQQGEGAAIFNASPFFLDEDSGAEKIWRISLAHDRNRRFAIYEELDWLYRARGYVFWDQKRLQILGALDSPWKPARRSAVVVHSAHASELMYSWHVRAGIYDWGGRGYWAKGDESQIIWEQNEREPEPHVEPKSLEEAKHFWRVLRANNW